jgi:ribose/xylose/arabinose/galactoside ABC-type transport system permease subunit
VKANDSGVQSPIGPEPPIQSDTVGVAISASSSVGGPRGRGAFYNTLVLPWLQRYGSFLALIILIVITSIISPNFLTQLNIRLQSQTFCLSYALIGVGQLLVILTGGIDLSVGAVLAVGSCSAAVLMNNGYGSVAAFALPMLICCALGGFSGIVISKTGIQPIVVTLAVMIAARGVAETIASAGVTYIQDPNFITYATTNYGPVPVLGLIPMSVILTIAVYVVAALFLARTVVGRHIFSVGGNERATRLAGIPVDRVKILVYAASGLLAGLAGVLYASHNSTADPFNDGLYFELQSIAMVVVGGTSLLGGSGGVGRTMTGGLILTVLYALFIQAGWPTQTQLIANGIIVAAAVILQGGLARQ